LDINHISGSGPGGRVMKKDIQNHFELEQQGKTDPSADEAPRLQIEDLSQIRKTIARRMSVSKQTAAHMTVIEEVEVSRLVKLREEHKEQFKQQGVKLTYMPFILKAVTLALKEHPALNSELDMDNNRMIYKKYYNIGIAVDTEEGLVVPVIRDVDRLTMLALSQQLIDISEKARSRQLTLEDMKDGTFTVTNYGSIGGTFGVPVINFPQAAILGVGRIMKRPVVAKDDIVVGYVLPLSMSVDHRIVDGGEAARFIMRVIDYLRDPVSLLLMG
jgi:pyruvate dehydrogenase E2 component (dihydrolipoamide acetyltransferase)